MIKKKLSKKVRFNSEESLHMRTAGRVSVIAHKYPNVEIVIKKDKRKATADSVLSLVMLEIKNGDEVEIIVSSENENENYLEMVVSEVMEIVDG